MKIPYTFYKMKMLYTFFLPFVEKTLGVGINFYGCRLLC